MNEYSRQDIIDIVEEEDVSFIRLQFTDMHGTLRNIAVPVGQLDKVLNNEVKIERSSMEGFEGDGEFYLFLVPDPNTFKILPWRPQHGKVGRLLCDLYTADGKPFWGCSRSVLKRVFSEAREMGYSFRVGSECEFFMFSTDNEGRGTTHTPEHAGLYDVEPKDTGENARRDIVLTLEEMGFQMESSYHEMAPGQHEVDFHWTKGLDSADNLMTFKNTVRTIARRHGMHATFMPKPKTGVPGSGMHLNLALYDREGKNLFYDEEKPMCLSDTGRYFIGGLFRYMDAMCVITNPLVNSYKRLLDNEQTSFYKAWSSSSESALLRIPAPIGTDLRLELRSPDPAANPYLALSAVLAAGMRGIQEKICPPAPVDRGNDRMTEEEKRVHHIPSLPNTLGEAIQALEADDFFCKVLGERYVANYLNLKRREWREYMKEVSAWEVEKYLYTI